MPLVTVSQESRYNQELASWYAHAQQQSKLFMLVVSMLYQCMLKVRS
jgi:hypothetical protein